GDGREGWGGGPGRAAPRPASHPRPDSAIAESDQPAGETWPMSLREACRIALGNRQSIRVISPGADGQPPAGFGPTRTISDASPIVVAPRSSAVDAQRFRLDLMAEVRSVEQQYW